MVAAVAHRVPGGDPLQPYRTGGQRLRAGQLARQLLNTAAVQLDAGAVRRAAEFGAVVGMVEGLRHPRERRLGARVGGGSWQWGVSATSSNPTAANAFIEFLTVAVNTYCLQSQIILLGHNIGELDIDKLRKS